MHHESSAWMDVTRVHVRISVTIHGSRQKFVAIVNAHVTPNVQVVALVLAMIAALSILMVMISAVLTSQSPSGIALLKMQVMLSDVFDHVASSHTLVHWLAKETASAWITVNKKRTSVRRVAHVTQTVLKAAPVLDGAVRSN